MSLTERECPLVIQKVLERTYNFTRPESVEKALSFQPQPGDILLTTGIKCGTSWMQQILHGLRSGGNMDFVEIDSVIPFIEFYYEHGEDDDLHFTQPFEPPRFLRMHLPKEVTPKGFSKFIVVTRNPTDSIVSGYFFLQNWLFEEGEVDINEFVEWFIIQDNVPNAPFANAHQIHHLISWFPHRKDENVLWLHFEDMKADLTQCIRLVSKFLGIGENDPELLKKVEHQASFDFMQKHRTQFDMHPFKLARNEAMGVPRDNGTKGKDGRVRKGVTRDGIRSLNDEMNQKMEMKWKELAEPITGYGSYEEMRAAINEEFGRSFVRST